MPDTRASTSYHERLAELAECGPETPMGQLLRRFWQPVAVADRLEPGKAMAVRIMGEDLTLYRGASGEPYLVGGRCPHRRTVLHTGWVQGEEIRCIYHGWKFSGEGRCTEAPAEGDETAARVSIPAYPAKEYSKLIFAYMGGGDAPEFDLPRKEALEKPGVAAFGRQEIWPCNWFQLVENSLDAVHVSFVHQAGKVGPFGEAITAAIPELEYQETDAGIRQIARRGAGNERISDWTFPNYNHIVIPGLPGDPWIDTCVWRVPVDEHQTLRLGIYAVNSDDPAACRRFADYFARVGGYDPSKHHDDLMKHRIYPDDRIIQLTSAQDYVAAIGQGALADRAGERLGKSDQGLAVLRRIFWREMDALRAGGPVKKWRRLPELQQMPRPATAGSVENWTNSI